MSRRRRRPLAALALLAALYRPAAAQRPVGDEAALRTETAKLLGEYIRINSSNPPGGELATARWLQATLAREGIEGRILDTLELGPGRANFYARLKGDGTNPKAIALVHHMDVVPVSREYWSVDPFAGVERDGHVWGRGALDMKGHAIIQLMSVIALKRAGIVLPRDVVFIANADEESDGLGSRTFVARHADLLADVEYLLTEGADTPADSAGHTPWFGVSVGEKRPFWQRLTVRGTASHGSVPTPGNPVARLARIIARIAAWEPPVQLLPAVARELKAQAATEPGEGRRWLADPAAALRSPRGRAWLLADRNRAALLRNTVSPTVLVGSNKTNTIPPVASVELDIRLLPGQDTLAFLRELRRVIDDPGAELASIGDTPPEFNAKLDTPLMHAIEQVAGRMVPGAPISTQVGAGATDRPYYAVLGITCYGIDPYLVPIAEQRTGVHGNDERISVANLGFGVRFYTELLQTLK